MQNFPMFADLVCGLLLFVVFMLAVAIVIEE